MSKFVFVETVDSSVFSDTLEIELVVDYDYQPYERGAREDGVPMEPDTEEGYEINSIAPNDSEPSLLALAFAEHYLSCGDMDELMASIEEDRKS